MSKIYMVQMLCHNQIVERSIPGPFIEKTPLKFFASEDDAFKWADDNYVDLLRKNRERGFKDLEVVEEVLN